MPSRWLLLAGGGRLLPVLGRSVAFRGMEEQPEGGASGEGSSGPARYDQPLPIPPPPPLPEAPARGPFTGAEAEALEAEAVEIRRLIEAGASSPEELRELAARMRAHREREEALWRAQVKPTLKPKRGGIVGVGRADAGAAAAPERDSSQQSLLLGLGLLALVVLVVLLAASSSVVWVLLPVVAVLAAAWWQGRKPQG